MQWLFLSCINTTCDPGRTIPEPVLSRYKDSLRTKNDDNQIDIGSFISLAENNALTIIQYESSIYLLSEYVMFDQLKRTELQRHETIAIFQTRKG